MAISGGVSWEEGRGVSKLGMPCFTHRVVLGLYWGYIRIMEKKMKTTMYNLGFPIIMCTFLGGPYNKDYSILGSILGSPYFGKLPAL